MNAILAQHREWKAKFDAATPEEQKIMIAERDAKREQEKRDRQERIENDRKGRFSEKAETEIETLKMLIKGRKAAMGIIKSFDGKVLNRRLSNILNDELKKIDRFMYCTLNIEYDYEQKANVGRLEISTSRCGQRYQARESFRLKIFLTSPAERVIFETTDSYADNAEKILSDQITMWKKAVRDYDKTRKMAAKVYSVIEDYAKSNYHLRDFFKTEYIVSNTYYL